MNWCLGRTKKGKDRGGKGKQQQSRMKLKSLEDKKEEEEEVHVINEWELGPISIKEQLTHIKTYDVTLYSAFFYLLPSGA